MILLDPITRIGDRERDGFADADLPAAQPTDVQHISTDDFSRLDIEDAGRSALGFTEVQARRRDGPGVESQATGGVGGMAVGATLATDGGLAFWFKGGNTTRGPTLRELMSTGWSCSYCMVSL